MILLEKLRQDIEGAKLLRDWLGEGGMPVSQTHADHRADVCVHGNEGDPCVFNVAPHWWNLLENAKNAIAETIQAELELKNHLEMHADQEESLGMCRGCGCCLRLLVWTPKERLKEHTTAEQIEKLPAFCWKRIELQNYA